MNAACSVAVVNVTRFSNCSVESFPLIGRDCPGNILCPDWLGYLADQGRSLVILFERYLPLDCEHSSHSPHVYTHPGLRGTSALFLDCELRKAFVVRKCWLSIGQLGEFNRLLSSALERASQQDCTQVQCSARRGDERVDALVSVAPSAPSLLDLSHRGRGGVVVRVLAFHQGAPGSITGGVAPRFSRVGIAPDDAEGRRLFSEISRPPPPRTLHSGAAPYSPRFTLMGSEDLDVKSRPNIFTRSLTRLRERAPPAIKLHPLSTLGMLLTYHPLYLGEIAVNHVGSLAVRSDGRNISCLLPFPRPHRHSPWTSAKKLVTQCSFKRVPERRWAKREISEKTRRPAASSGTFPTCEDSRTNPVRLVGWRSLAPQYLHVLEVSRPVSDVFSDMACVCVGHDIAGGGLERFPLSMTDRANPGQTTRLVSEDEGLRTSGEEGRGCADVQGLGLDLANGRINLGLLAVRGRDSSSPHIGRAKRGRTFGLRALRQNSKSFVDFTHPHNDGISQQDTSSIKMPIRAQPPVIRKPTVDYKITFIRSSNDDVSLYRRPPNKADGSDDEDNKPDAARERFYAHDIGDEVIATHRRAEAFTYSRYGQLLLHEVVQHYRIDIVEIKKHLHIWVLLSQCIDAPEIRSGVDMIYRRPAHATRRGTLHTCSGWGRTRLGKVKEAAGIAERRMEGSRVCEAELVASSSHQTALARARSAARLSSSSTPREKGSRRGDVAVSGYAWGREDRYSFTSLQKTLKYLKYRENNCKCPCLIFTCSNNKAWQRNVQRTDVSVIRRGSAAQLTASLVTSLGWCVRRRKREVSLRYFRWAKQCRESAAIRTCVYGRLHNTEANGIGVPTERACTVDSRTQKPQVFKYPTLRRRDLVLLAVKSRPNLFTRSVDVTGCSAAFWRRFTELQDDHLISAVQLCDWNTARHARRSHEALGVRVTVARIAHSLLDLGRAAT
ncbi:hypothetical protein PR048_007186 [Dryococelus australis]|uniref:Uncharacterized protein n=1 Tax=Dryococelus australis TaxID=614101 RepID=A0ABQ9ICX9_9NEOP|nr:hypothetical protein PR048_007186 [Dryococelus australis]